MAEFTIDCLGEACPVPLMKVQKQCEKMAVGDVLIASIDHSCAMKNVPEWARNQGYNVERSRKWTTENGKSSLKKQNRKAWVTL